MNCLLIGGGGFIGQYLARLLTERGRKVFVLGRQPQPSSPIPKGVTYISGDYGDEHTLRGLLDQVEEVVDLAYATVPKSSFEDPVFDLHANLPLAVNMFQQAAQSKHLKRIVVVSSGGTVYGHAESLPIPESSTTNPVSPYGITKLAIEKYGLMFHRLVGLPLVVVRPANAYGEGQQAFRGQGFIATAVASILQGLPITVFGGDSIVRDYVHVEDVAVGIVAALERGQVGACYNVGSGVGHTTNQVLSMISELARDDGLSVEIIDKPTRPFDVPINVLDCAKLRNDSGWRSRVELTEGIERVWCWTPRSPNSGQA